MINRAEMLEQFEEMYGVPDDPLPEEVWSAWMGIWAVAWKQAELAMECEPSPLTPYEILGTDRSSCPMCRGDARILCPADTANVSRYPAFALCSECNYVGQIAVGPVPVIANQEG